MSSVEKPRKVAPASVAMREFQPADAKPLKNLTKRALGEDYPLSLFLDIHSWWPEGFVVVERGGEVLAFVAGIVSAPKKGRVLMLAVRTGHRNRGIGRSLMETFMERCKARGLHSVELEVRKSNEGAIRFYQNLGFEIQYFLPRFYTDGEDGYKMWRTLPRE